VTQGTIWAVRGGRGSPEQGFHDGANRAVGSDGGGTKEQPRAPARGLRELLASVRSSGRCWEVRGTDVAVRGGSMTASMATQWWQQAEEERVPP
jgi:hypothetical protein